MTKQITLDLPEKVKILGINGSPRKGGNTSEMVKYSLEWAERLGYVETEYVSLADYKWYPCTGCMKCFGFMAPADDPYQCYEFPDDGIKVLAPKIAECDGLLLAFPIYTGGVPGMFRCFHEKLHQKLNDLIFDLLFHFPRFTSMVTPTFVTLPHPKNRIEIHEF